MFKSITSAKLKAFQGYATCAWTQKQAEDIWSETMWKLGLTANELRNVSAGWAKFVVSGDTATLNNVCSEIFARLNH